MTVKKSENVANLAISTEASDQHLDRAKWFTLAMLVCAIAGTTLAVYLGSHLWHVGASISQNIHYLLDSIPFDGAFIVGYSTGLIGLVSAIYCVYRFCQN